MSSIASTVRNQQFDNDIRDQLHKEIHGLASQPGADSPQYPANETIPHMENYTQATQQDSLDAYGQPAIGSVGRPSGVRYSVGVNQKTDLHASPVRWGNPR